MDKLFELLKQVAVGLSDSARYELMTAIHQLAYSLENTNDTIHRIGYLVSTPPPLPSRAHLGPRRLGFAL